MKTHRFAVLVLVEGVLRTAIIKPSYDSAKRFARKLNRKGRTASIKRVQE
jgi:hypothetical protein